jgi:hypothetical protein
MESLAGVRGVSRAHLEEADGKARRCAHYDPALVSLTGVERASSPGRCS